MRCDAAADGCTADEAWQNEIDLVLMGCNDLFASF